MVHINTHTRIFITICITFIAIVMTNSACKKFVEVDPPVNEIVSSVVFTTDAMATSAVTGIYSEMMSSSAKFSAGEVTFYAGLAADELITSPNSTRDPFFKNQITAGSHPTILSIFWDKAYKFIYSANLCLEGLDQATLLSPSVKNRLMGECKFIRAFCFFHLVNLFGDVPLTTVSDYRINAVLPRASVLSVYEQMIMDLKEAKDLLSTEYPTTDRVRPNKWAATSLLARIYLYKSDWAKAETEADSVINAGNYILQDSVKDVFLKSSTEAIWQLLPVNTTLNNTWEGNTVIPPSNTSVIYITETLLKSFESGDRRRKNWIDSIPISTGEIKYYPFKYKIKISGTKLEYYMVFRLAEQFLIRAEARAQQNKLAESTSDVNIIRSRAGLPNITANSQPAILAAIEQERKIELFAEWGHRWYDLKRTNRATDVLTGLKAPLWQPTDVLWPIPNSQILYNPALTQNPGY